MSCYGRTAAIAADSRARFNGHIERQLCGQTRTSTECTLNRKLRRSNPNALPRRCLGHARGPGAGDWGTPESPESRPLRGGVGHPCTGPRCPLGTPAVPTPVTGATGLRQNFTLPRRPEKLKTWNPDVLLGVAATRIPDFQNFRFSPPPSAPEKGVPAQTPVVTVSWPFSWLP
jgi:hypothetical protein